MSLLRRKRRVDDFAVIIYGILLARLMEKLDGAKETEYDIALMERMTRMAYRGASFLETEARRRTANGDRLD